MSELHDRNTYITFIPGHGNDPLSDKLMGELLNVPMSQTYMIPKYDEFRSDKIAAKFFDDSSMYWIILEYNNCLSNSDLIAGRVIEIPSVPHLNNILITSTKETQSKTLYIK